MSRFLFGHKVYVYLFFFSDSRKLGGLEGKFQEGGLEFLEVAERCGNCHRVAASESTPDMTGSRFHRTTEVISRRPWNSESPPLLPDQRTSMNKGTQGVSMRYEAVLLQFISIVRSTSRPVISAPD